MGTLVLSIQQPCMLHLYTFDVFIFELYLDNSKRKRLAPCTGSITYNREWHVKNQSYKLKLFFDKYFELYVLEVDRKIIITLQWNSTYRKCTNVFWSFLRFFVSLWNGFRMTLEYFFFELDFAMGFRIPNGGTKAPCNGFMMEPTISNNN